VDVPRPDEQDLAQFLGDRAYSILSLVTEPKQHTRVAEVLRTCADALAILDGFELERYELAMPETDDRTAWNEVRPALDHLLSGLGAALGALSILLGEKRPQAERKSPPNTPTPPGTPLRDSRDLDIDATVTTADISVPRTITDATIQLLHMLRWDLANASYRLGDSRLAADRWMLLAELQELRGRCTQGFEAVVATVFRGLTDVDLEGLLPRYVSSTRRAIELRTAFSHLRFEMEVLNQGMQKARGTELSLLHDACMKAVERFVAQPGFGYIRASDKREVIRFRLFLRDWPKSGANPRELKQKSEAFAKLSEVFVLINRRPQLLAHDRAMLNEAERSLREERDVAGALVRLESVFGRSATLDVILRQHWAGEAIEEEVLSSSIERAIRDLS
jgi:hypothetical protein